MLTLRPSARLPVFLLVFALAALAASASVPPEDDRRAILAMAGSYEVEFFFEEALVYEPGLDHSEPHRSSGIEWVVVVADEPGFVSLQHILVTERGVVKHWRQDWEWENTRVLRYHADRTWRNVELAPDEVRGTWTQRVFQVDDSPRYEAIGRFAHVGDVSWWESEWTRRPLPRREFSKRDDYDVLLARNRQTITHDGWVHEQDNLKVVLDEEGQKKKVLARERGINEYTYVRDTLLEPAREYWREHEDYWALVREAWDELISSRSSLSLHAKVDDERLFMALFALQDELSDASAETVRAEVDALIGRYLVDERTSR